jgi:predicted nucleic acid-binding Zn finger protein
MVNAPSHGAQNQWKPCGDFRGLNIATVDDRYNIIDIGDFNTNLAGKTIFLKIGIA